MMMKRPALCVIGVSMMICIASAQSRSHHQNRVHLRAGSLPDVLPENTPATRFFKYSFSRLEEGDVKSLASAMKAAYSNLCVELHGCDRAEMELDDLYGRRFNELEINMGKMRKLGFLLQRLVSAAVGGADDEHP